MKKQKASEVESNIEKMKIHVTARSADNSYDAQGVFDGTRLTVLKGSIISLDLDTLLPADLRHLRLRELEGKTLRRDITFATPNVGAELTLA